MTTGSCNTVPIQYRLEILLRYPGGDFHIALCDYPRLTVHTPVHAMPGTHVRVTTALIQIAAGSTTEPDLRAPRTA